MFALCLVPWPITSMIAAKMAAMEKPSDLAASGESLPPLSSISTSAMAFA
jgi:hypothetical protein